MGVSSKQVTGYWYSMGIHFGLAHGPVDGITNIRGGDIDLWTGNMTASGNDAINAPSAYGGEKKEGGVQGPFSLMMGEPTQPANAYLTSKQGGLQPAYRGIASLVFNGTVGANNPYPKPWRFRVYRRTAGWEGGSAWYAAKAAIDIATTDAAGHAATIRAMNPAHIALEAMTNRDWGMGYPMSAFDLPTWQAAADQLYSEGLGLCLLWTRENSIQDFVQGAMNYAAGVIVSSRTPATAGQIQLKLIRGGYSTSGLPAFGPANVISLDSLDAAGTTGIANEIVASAVNPLTGLPITCTIQALGAIQAQGVVVTQKQDYPGLPTLDLLHRVAQRDLRGMSVPLKRLKIKFDRTAYGLTPGDVFLFSWPPLGIVNLAMRVGNTDGGTLVDGSITVDAVQDIFGMPATTYLKPPDVGWTPPSRDPVPVTNQVAWEATYRQLYLNLSPGDLAALHPTDTYAGMYAARPSGVNYAYELWTRVSPASFAEVVTGHFTPYGLLKNPIGPFDTSAQVDTVGATDLGSVQVGDTARIGNEIVRIDAFVQATGAMTLGRGSVDTVAAAHAAGVGVWFGETLYAGDPTLYAPGESVDMRPLTITSTGTLPLASASTSTVALGAGGPSGTAAAARQIRPYPPTYMTVNGTRWDQIPAGGISGTLTLTWRQRNRLTEQNQIIDETAATITPETGTTYTVALLDNAGATFATFTGIAAGTSWSWPTPDDVHGAMRVQLWAVRDGYPSFAVQDSGVFQRYGWGLLWDTHWGG